MWLLRRPPRSSSAVIVSSFFSLALLFGVKGKLNHRWWQSTTFLLLLPGNFPSLSPFSAIHSIGKRSCRDERGNAWRSFLPDFKDLKRQKSCGIELLAFPLEKFHFQSVLKAFVLAISNSGRGNKQKGERGKFPGRKNPPDGRREGRYRSEEEKIESAAAHAGKEKKDKSYFGRSRKPITKKSPSMRHYSEEQRKGPLYVFCSIGFRCLASLPTCLLASTSNPKLLLGPIKGQFSCLYFLHFHTEKSQF